MRRAGEPFTEHRYVPGLRPGRPENGMAAYGRHAPRSYQLRRARPGDDLPSVSELARPQGLRPGTVQHAFLAIAEEGLLVIRHG